MPDAMACLNADDGDPFRRVVVWLKHLLDGGVGVVEVALATGVTRRAVAAKGFQGEARSAVARKLRARSLAW